MLLKVQSSDSRSWSQYRGGLPCTRLQNLSVSWRPAVLIRLLCFCLLQLASISEKYGGVNVASKFGAELQEVYDQYINSILPSGAEPLK